MGSEVGSSSVGNWSVIAIFLSVDVQKFDEFYNESNIWKYIHKLKTSFSKWNKTHSSAKKARPDIVTLHTGSELEKRAFLVFDV